MPTLLTMLALLAQDMGALEVVTVESWKDNGRSSGPAWLDLQDSPDKDAAGVVEKLKSTTVSVEFKDTSLADFARLMGQFLGRTVTVSRTIENADEITFNGTFDQRSVRDIAKAALKGKGLTMTIRKGVVTIVTQKEIDEQLSTRDYDVSHVVHPIFDYGPASFDPWRGLQGAPSRPRSDNARAAALGWGEDPRLDDDHYGRTPQERRRNVLKEDILQGREGFLDAAPAGAGVEFLPPTYAVMRLTHIEAGHKKVRFLLDLYRPR